MNRRTDRVANLLKEEISRMLVEDLKDPRVKGLLTIAHVDVAPDMRNATVAVSVLGSPAQQKEALWGMESAIGFIRKELAVRLRLRYVPQLRFVLDTSMEKASEMWSLIDRVRAEDESLHERE